MLAAELPTLIPAPLQKLRAAYVRRPPRAHQNTERNTRGNIAHHYDLSNDLFRLFLDETLSYSSALYDTSSIDRGDHLRGRAARGPPTRVPGRGAGAQDRAAARPDRRRRGHPRPRDRHRLGRAGDPRGPPRRDRALGDAVQRAARARRASGSPTPGTPTGSTVELQRLPRASQGSYDAVVSVEMIEAVGHEYWSTYFQHHRPPARTRAAGSAIQAITMPHDRMLATRHTWTWINKYIFPGGFLPSVQAIDEITRADTSAADRPTGCRSAQHYAETLRRWDDAFLGGARRGARARLRRDLPSGCGTSTSTTRAPGSPRATSTCSS